MEEKKQNIIEREYTIPLREKVRSVPRYKKTNKAVRTIKEFLAKHMKVYD
ncbi:MAG: 50S ribosomal protein L31e, partial [Nanoarchaeota archaeon]